MYFHVLTKEDYCLQCNKVLIRGIWNPKTRKVVNWCPTCNPDGIKDCIMHEGEGDEANDK